MITYAPKWIGVHERSARGHLQTFDAPKRKCALTPKADIGGARRHVCLRPIGDIVRRHAPTLVRRFGGAEHVVRCQGTSNTFQHKLTHRLDRDRVFDRRENARTD